METGQENPKQETAQRDDARPPAAGGQGGNPDLRALNTGERTQLAARAKRQRITLHLSRKDVAAAMNVPVLTLFNWEQCLVRRAQPREQEWEDALGVPRGWLRDVQALSGASGFGPHRMLIGLPQAATVAQEIRAICCCLVRRSVAGAVPAYTSLHASEQRRADILALRYGVAGKDESLLGTIGRRYGLTRQSIYAVWAGVAEREAALRFTTPRFDQLAAEVQQHLPASVAALDAQLRPLLGEALSIQHADAFARKVLGMPIVNLIERPVGFAGCSKLIAVRSGRCDPEIAAAVQACAMRMVRDLGAARIQSVVSAVSWIFANASSAAETLALCKLVDGFEWLAEEQGWFWFGPAADNRMVVKAAKVLAAAQRPVSVDEIQRVLQAAGDASTAPPLAVITAILKRVTWIELVQSDAPYAKATPTLEGILSCTQSAAYCFLLPDDGVARYMVAREPLDAARMRSVVLQRSFGQAPTVTRVARRVYALRARWLAPHVFAAAGRAPDANGYGSVAAGLDRDGWYDTSLVLTPHSYKARTWAVPHSLARVMVQGAYRVDGADRPAHFTAYGNGAKRLKKIIGILIDAGMRINDRALLSVHPEQRRIRIQAIIRAGVDDRTPGPEDGGPACAACREPKF
jgi:transcriptional regulator with XRE-family HTH domain